MADNLYRPGDQVPVSGVYMVVHVDHRPDHVVTLLANEKFPPCSVCAGEVRFRLEQSAQQQAATTST